MEEDKNLDVKLALEEMRLAHKQIYKNGDVIDQKVNMILVAAGLIIALTTSIQISVGLTRCWIFWVIFITGILLYFLAIFGTLIGARPTTYKLPISAKWEVLNDHIFGESERDAILNILSGYSDQIQYNEAINKRKGKIFLISVLSLFVSVLLIISLVLVSI